MWTIVTRLINTNTNTNPNPNPMPTWIRVDQRWQAFSLVLVFLDFVLTTIDGKMPTIVMKFAGDINDFADWKEIYQTFNAHAIRWLYGVSYKFIINSQTQKTKNESLSL